MKFCLYCRVHHLIAPKPINYGQMRKQSALASLLTMTKGMKHKTKKYGELEVNDETLINRKLRARQINPTQLLFFVNKYDISIDSISHAEEIKLLKFNESQPYNKCSLTNEVDHISPQVGSYVVEKSNDEVRRAIDHVSIIEDLQTSGISDSASLIKSASLLTSISKGEETHEEFEEENETPSNTNQEPPRKREKSVKQKLKTDPKEAQKFKLIYDKSRTESVIRTLSAYLHVCVSCGMTGRAFHTVMHYRELNRNEKSLIIKDIRLYNILLQSYAHDGNLSKVQEIMKYIKEDQLKSTAETYSAVFECYGNSYQALHNLEYLYKIRDNMIKQSITYDDVLKKSRKRLGQYDRVFRIIRLVEPQFEKKKNIKNETYDTHLLKKLNPKSTMCKSPAENLLTLNDLSNGFKSQIKHEMNGYIEVKSVEKFEENPSVEYYKKVVADLENTWKITISEAFDRDLKALKHREYKPIPNSMVLYPCLCVLDKEEYVNAILREIRKLIEGSETFSPSFAHLCKSLGKDINTKYQMLEYRRNGYVHMLEKAYLEYCDWYINRKDIMNSRIAWQRIVNETSPNFSLDLRTICWPNNLKLAVGKFLYGIILKDVKIDVNYKEGTQSKRYLPAFYTLFRSINHKRIVEEIKPHPVASKIYRASQPETLIFDSTLTPSLCPSRPWSSVHNGGFMLLKTDVIRVPTYTIEQLNRLDKTPPSQMWPSLDALNQLSSVPWVVNNRILDIVIKIFRDGGSVKLNVPQPPSVLSPIPLLQSDSSEHDRKSVIKARLELKRKKNEMHSLWCDALYRLSLANHYRDKIFWLPHNMDFRGRVYPIPPHLNHLGSDLARSMLQFALGKPLGPKGLDWLKIHTINLTGLKKRESISERLRYANEILDTIVDSGENPLTGKMWWAESDEPWQTLAACMEIVAALKAPDPSKYICQFPIHQDGSCNGLQHYAALGRDQIGAVNVNLYPSNKPQDVYSSVAAMVEKIRQEDAENGNHIAIILEGFVVRKVIKQTVMTTVYGVTKFGARLQIARQLKDLDNFPSESVWHASLYLTQKTFQCLGAMFESARQIQDWFTDCARTIATFKRQNIEWITPLGLPVIQPYSKISSSKNGFHDIFVDNLGKPNTVKQKNAFAPNFVHSLDSCHMMLTSLHCEDVALTFVSVHDCYWTHPSTVEIMNKICREQFVALHSEPILENLSNYFVEIYVSQQKENADINDVEMHLSNRKVLRTLYKVPKKGNFDLSGVLKSTYFFS